MSAISRDSKRQEADRLEREKQARALQVLGQEFDVACDDRAARLARFDAPMDLLVRMRAGSAEVAVLAPGDPTVELAIELGSGSTAGTIVDALARLFESAPALAEGEQLAIVRLAPPLERAVRRGALEWQEAKDGGGWFRAWVVGGDNKKKAAEATWKPLEDDRVGDIMPALAWLTRQYYLPRIAEHLQRIEQLARDVLQFVERERRVKLEALVSTLGVLVLAFANGKHPDAVDEGELRHILHTSKEITGHLMLELGDAARSERAKDELLLALDIRWFATQLYWRAGFDEGIAVARRDEAQRDVARLREAYGDLLERRARLLFERPR